ncbi:hypothetical protein Tco_0292251 [Tanacetum coccineum]
MVKAGQTRTRERKESTKAGDLIARAPPSPDYVPVPEYPPSPDFVPEPVYSKFMPLEDEILPAEEQPLPATDSPTADSPGYIPRFYSEEMTTRPLGSSCPDYPPLTEEMMAMMRMSHLMMMRMRRLILRLMTRRRRSTQLLPTLQLLLYQLLIRPHPAEEN